MSIDYVKLADDVRKAVEQVRPLPDGMTLIVRDWLGGLYDGWADPVLVSVCDGAGRPVGADNFGDGVCDLAEETYDEQVAWLAQQVVGL